MELADFLQNDFGIVARDGVPTMLIQTMHLVKSFAGTLEEENTPEEKSLEVLKKSFYLAVMDLLAANGVEPLINHPAKFIREFAKDVFVGKLQKKEYRSPATRMLEEFSSYTDQISKEEYLAEQQRLVSEAKVTLQ